MGISLKTPCEAHTTHQRDFPKRRIIIAIQVNKKITLAAIHLVNQGPAWPLRHNRKPI
jgi:hypothetical protein